MDESALIGQSPRPGPRVRVPRFAAVAGALLVPLAVAALLGLLRGSLGTASAALVLALVIMGAAGTGYRAAGILAALSAGAWFDFFLTAPYQTFSVTDPSDIQTLIVLVLLGIAANEIIQWGRRHQLQLRDRDTYLGVLLALSGSDVTDADAIRTLRDTVGQRLSSMLDLDACTWVDSMDETAPRLDRDGEIRHRGRRFRVEADGWPTQTTVSLPIRPADPSSPGFTLTAATHISRPPLQQRQLAGALADELGWITERADR